MVAAFVIALVFFIAGCLFTLVSQAVRHGESAAFVRAAVASARLEKWTNQNGGLYNSNFGSLVEVDPYNKSFQEYYLGGCRLSRRQYKSIRRAVFDSRAMESIRSQSKQLTERIGATDE